MKQEGGWSRVHWLPVFVFFLMPLTLVTTYVMAVMWEHVEPDFPYISETGTFPPESCVFGQFINLTALLLLVMLYIRYRQIEEFSLLRPGRIPPWINGISGVIGVIGLAGLDIVANFQQSNIFVVHVIGAIANFSAGTIYFCMQTWFTKKMLPEVGSPSMVYIRSALCVLCVVFTLTTITAGPISVRHFTGKDTTKWGPEDGGYELHLVSTVSEWLLVLCYSAFALAFAQEFRYIIVHSPVVILTNVSPLESNTEISNVLKHM